jgi:hypothetical protein
MTHLQDSNATDSFDNSKVVIQGGTDNTSIGNTGDRLKVDALASVADVQNKTFCILAENIVIGNNKSMVSLLNATGSTVIIKIREINLINTQNTAVTGIVSNFEMRRMTGHSVGTSLTPNPYDTNDTLDVNVTARTNATIAGEGVMLHSYRWSSDEWGVGSHDVESNDHVLVSLIPFYTVQPYCKPITLRANQGIHIKHTVNSTAGQFTIIMTFTEETS